MDNRNNLIEILKFQAENNGNNLFLHDRNRNVTYGQFYKTILSLSKELSYLKQPGSPNIGLCYSDTIDFLFRFFAFRHLELIPVLISYKLTDIEIIELLKLTECSCLLSDTGRLEFESDNINFVPHSNRNTGNNNTACILFTSGTTSKAKGVVISEKSITTSAKNFCNYFNISQNDKFISSLPLYHIGGLMIFIRALPKGSSVYVTNLLKGELFIDEIIYSKPDYISVVPTQLQYLLQSENINKNIKAIIIGGASTPDKLIKEATEKNLPIYKVYGSSETCSMTTISGPEDIKRFPKSSGKPFAGIEIQTVDNMGNKNGFDVEGEIVIKSNTLFSEYHNMPEVTKNKLINNEYFTGDFGYINSKGFLFVLERREDIIIRGGENISPYEIESEIKKLPQIKDVKVIGITNEKLGQVPVAFIIKSEEISNGTIQEHLSQLLAEYKIPRVIITVNNFPMNETGKINIAKLREIALQSI